MKTNLSFPSSIINCSASFLKSFDDCPNYTFCQIIINQTYSNFVCNISCIYINARGAYKFFFSYTNREKKK